MGAYSFKAQFVPYVLDGSLAWRDGFRFNNSAGRLELTGSGGCFDMMLEFWLKNHGTTEFHGDIIHWDYERRMMLAEGSHV